MATISTQASTPTARPGFFGRLMQRLYATYMASAMYRIAPTRKL